MRSFLKQPQFLILLCAVLLLLPAVYFGPSGFDLRCVGLRARLFSAQFWQGELYPRWLGDAYDGYGSPVFFYYPPLSYFAAALFAPLLRLDPFGFYALAAAALLAVCIAGFSFHAWMKEEGCSPGAALLGSLLYMAAPQNLGNNFYYWMLYSSVWAYAWLPLLFLYARRIARQQPYGIAGFAISLALLVTSSLPMTLLFGPAAVAYGIYCMYADRARVKQKAMNLSLATLLGFGLSSVYLLPALLYMDYAHVDQFWSASDTDYHHYFLPLGFARSSQAIYSAVWLVLLGLTLLYGWIVRKTPPVFFVAVSLAALFMIMPQSVWLWEHISLLKILQFPERFFIMPPLCIAVLAAHASPRLRVAGYALVAVFACLIVGMAGWDQRTSLDKLREKPLNYQGYMLNVDQYAQYYPVFGSVDALNDRFYSLDGLKALVAHRDKIMAVQGSADVQIDSWQSRKITFHYTAATPSVLQVRRFYFPGTMATVNGQMDAVQYNDQTDEILLNVAPGAGEVSLELTALLPEVMGRMLSLISAGIVAALLFATLRQNAQKTQA